MESLCRDSSDTDHDPLPGHTIEFAAAACELAKAIWCARRTAYHEPRQWFDLSTAQRHSRVLQAAWVLTIQKRDTL